MINKKQTTMSGFHEIYAPGLMTHSKLITNFFFFFYFQETAMKTKLTQNTHYRKLLRDPCHRFNKRRPLKLLESIRKGFIWRNVSKRGICGDLHNLIINLIFYFCLFPSFLPRYEAEIMEVTLKDTLIRSLTTWRRFGFIQ